MYKIHTFKDKYSGRHIALYTHKENKAYNKAYVDVGTELTQITNANKFGDLNVHMYHPTPEERQLLTTVEVHRETASRVRKHLEHTHAPSQKKPVKETVKESKELHRRDQVLEDCLHIERHGGKPFGQKNKRGLF